MATRRPDIAADMARRSFNVASNSVEPSPTPLNSVEQRPTMSDSVEHSRLSFRLPEGKRQELERIAARRGMNLSNLVRSIVFEYLEKGR